MCFKDREELYSVAERERDLQRGNAIATFRERGADELNGGSGNEFGS